LQKNAKTIAAYMEAMYQEFPRGHFDEKTNGRLMEKIYEFYKRIKDPESAILEKNEKDLLTFMRLSQKTDEIYTIADGTLGLQSDSFVVRQSTIAGAGNGLFCLRDIPPEMLVADGKDKRKAVPILQFWGNELSVTKKSIYGIFDVDMQRENRYLHDVTEYSAKTSVSQYFTYQKVLHTDTWYLANYVNQGSKSDHSKQSTFVFDTIKRDIPISVKKKRTQLKKLDSDQFDSFDFKEWDSFDIHCRKINEEEKEEQSKTLTPKEIPSELVIVLNPPRSSPYQSSILYKDFGVLYQVPSIPAIIVDPKFLGTNLPSIKKGHEIFVSYGGDYEID